MINNILFITQFNQLVAFDLSVRADISMINKPLTDAVIGPKGIFYRNIIVPDTKKKAFYSFTRQDELMRTILPDHLDHLVSACLSITLHNSMVN